MHLLRRDKNDTNWQTLKKEVLKRDRTSCQLMKVLTAQEMGVLKHLAPPYLLKVLDPAHYYPVSTHPHLIYTKENVYTLNRYSHEHLDNCENPLTGEPITFEERDLWWKRLIGINRMVELSSLIKNGVNIIDGLNQNDYK